MRDFEIPAWLYEKMEACAAEEGVTIDELVERAMEWWLQKMEAENGEPFPPRPRTLQGRKVARYRRRTWK